MSPLLSRAGWRYWLRNPTAAVLSIIGIALGVGVVVAVDLANESARKAFDLSMEAIVGRATHQIVGGPNGLDERLYVRLRTGLGVRAAAPVVEGLVRVRGETFRLIGLDPFAESPFARSLAPLSDSPIEALLSNPQALLVPDGTARRLDIAPDDDLELEIGGEIRVARVAGLLASDRLGMATEGLLAADIGAAQALLGRIGRIDRIDLILGSDEELGRIKAVLPADARVVTADARTRTTRELSRAFHTNLTALSLLAVLVGGFLIYNTMTVSVLRRRAQLGTLRILGVTRGELFVRILREALLVGGLGTALGLGAGWIIAQSLLGLVTRTINDLYFVLTVTQVMPGALEFAKGIALGLVVTVVAALAPALEASRSSPLEARHRSVLERRAHRALPWASLVGLLIAALGLGLAQLPTHSLFLGFVALFLLVIGVSLLAPLALLGFARASTGLLGRLPGGIGRLAGRGIEAGLSRTGLAVAALAVAVSATVGVGVMISSFRTTVSAWLDQTLGADIYVSAPARSNARAGGELDPEIPEILGALAEVEELTTGRNVTVDSDRGPVELLAIRLGQHSHRGIRFKEGDSAQGWEQLRDGRAVLISEPLAFHRQLGVGDSLQLMTDQGARAFAIAGIFYDYSSSRGLVLMSRELYNRHWADRAISSVGVYLQPSSNPTKAIGTIRASLADLPRAVETRASSEIREISLEIFDRTFAITHVLRLLVIGVAFIGVLSALLALQLERTREHAILRAIGLTPAGLTGLVSLQTFLIGLAAGLIALPLGLLMAEVLIDTINVRAFGWSMQSHIPLAPLGGAVLLSVAAAGLAGLYPALRLARMAPANALHEE